MKLLLLLLDGLLGRTTARVKVKRRLKISLRLGSGSGGGGSRESVSTTCGRSKASGLSGRRSSKDHRILLRHLRRRRTKLLLLGYKLLLLLLLLRRRKASRLLRLGKVSKRAPIGRLSGRRLLRVEVKQERCGRLWLLLLLLLGRLDRSAVVAR
jgi:hypothetical protein